MSHIFYDLIQYNMLMENNYIFIKVIGFLKIKGNLELVNSLNQFKKLHHNSNHFLFSEQGISFILSLSLKLMWNCFKIYFSI